MPRLIILCFILAGLAGCASQREDFALTRLESTGSGPDEFSILPGKPLQSPEDTGSLPAPTPGGANLTDKTPRADGIAALGGNPGAGESGPSAADAALVNHTQRYGVAPGIRQTLRIEDDRLRRQHGRRNILNLNPTANYDAAYQREWLNSYAEYYRLRRRGVIVPAAPPPEED